MGTILQDLQYGWRMLRKTPGFTIVAVLTLALGIGANTAIFTLINAVMLKMLPVRDVERLVVIGDPTWAHSRSHGTPMTEIVSYPLYKEFRDNNSVFEGVLAAGEIHHIRAGKPTGESVSDQVLGVVVSGNYFSVLGVQPLIGRTLTEADDRTPGAHPVAVISESMFRNRFNSDPSVLGSTITLNDYPFTVVGVAPPGFNGQVIGDIQEVWVPLMMQSYVMGGRKWLDDERSSWLTLMGRLKPGVTIEQARANVNLVWKQALAGAYGAKLDPDDFKELQKQSIQVVPGARGMSVLRGNFGKPLMLLMAIVGLVLLIACVNVANLLLARATVRQREIAVRLAMGAKPWRVVRQLLTESVLLALLGGAAGMLVAFWGTQTLLTITRMTVEKTGLEVNPDARILGFTMAVCLLTGILFGLVPALRSLKVELNSTLKGSTTGQSPASEHGIHWGRLLVAGQVALSVLVVFSAGLLVRSMKNLERVDVGYEREHLLAARVDPVAGGYGTVEAAARLASEVTARLAHLPGVQGATAAQAGLFSGSDSSTTISTASTPAPGDNDRATGFDGVGPDYFHIIGVPVVLGRDISEQDTPSSLRVTVVNESLVQTYFHGENPIGRKIWINNPRYHDRPLEVVGVVKDIREHGLREPMQPTFYAPLAQVNEEAGIMQFLVRTASDPAVLSNSVRQEIKNYNPSLPIRSVETLPTLVLDTIRTQSIIAKLSSFFGGLALLLACIGLYGVMSYTVAGRTKEIGIRMALGAQQSNVLRFVMGQALSLVIIGVIIGVPLAMLSTRVIKSMLFGLTNTDPLSLGIAVALLAGIGTLAGLIPARRATKIDPMVALREE